MRTFREKNRKFSNISQFLKSFCVRNIKCKGFIWVAFHSVSMAQFSAFLSFLPLSISQQNCRKFSEKSGIFRFCQILFALV